MKLLFSVCFILVLTTDLCAFSCDTITQGNSTFVVRTDQEETMIWLVKGSDSMLVFHKVMHDFTRGEFEGYCYTTTCMIRQDTIIFQTERMEWDETVIRQVQFDENEVQPATHIWLTETYVLQDTSGQNAMKQINDRRTSEEVDLRYQNCPSGSRCGFETIIRCWSDLHSSLSCFAMHSER